MRERLRRVGTGLVLAWILTGAAEAGNLSGAGRALNFTAGAGQEAAIGAFNDSLATHAARAVDGVYQDLLQRAVDATGLALFGPQFENGDGRQNAVASVLGSAEYAGLLVRDWYEQFLGRTPGDREIEPFANALLSGARGEELLAVILGSVEYFNVRGGGANAGFLDAVYPDLLGRPVDDGARAYFTSFLAFNGTRSQVVAIIVASNEYRSRLVTSYYTQFLGRDPAASEVNAFVTQIQNGARFEDVIAAIVGSDEYYDRVPLPSYSAMIDWGDGSTNGVTPVANASGGFDVRAGHTYSRAGDFTIRIEISDGLEGTLVLYSDASVLLPAVQDDVLPAVQDEGVPAIQDASLPAVQDELPPAVQEELLPAVQAGDSLAEEIETDIADEALADALGDWQFCGLGLGLFTPLTVVGLGLMRRARRP